MSLVIALILIVVLLIYCANDKANIAMQRRNYEIDRPPCKLQEEYLLSCELYHKYLIEGRKDAYGDAIYDARRKIFNEGYLPSSLEIAGRSYWDKAGDNLRMKWLYGSGPHWMEPHNPPISIPNTNGYGEVSNAKGLAAWRDEDASKTALCGLRSAKYTDAEWMKYCEKIDAWYERLVLDCLADKQAIFINRHTGQTQIVYNRLGPYRKEYEAIIRKHKDEIPSYLAKRRMMQPLKPKQEPETPYGR